LFFGEARIAVVALLVGLFVSVFVWFCTRKDIWRTIGMIGIIAMVVIAGIGIKITTNPTSSLHTFFVKESGNRITDWQESLQGIKARPLFGWGPENFHAVYQAYFNPIVLSPSHGNEGWALHPHNNTLEVLVNGGIIGFLFYVLILITLFGGLFRLYKKEQIDSKTFALLLGMLVAFILQQQMIYDSIVSYTMFFSILAIIAGLTSGAQEKRDTVLHTQWTYVVGIVVTIVMIPLWFYLAYLPARKTEEFLQSTQVTSETRTAMYHHLFHSAGSYGIDTDPEFYTDPLFYSYDAQKEQLKNNPLYQKIASTEIQTLITEVTPLWQQHYYDYHVSLSLVQLENLEFYLTGNPQTLVAADAYAARGFSIAPTDPEMYTAYAQTLVYERNTAGAEVLLDKALALNPQYQSAINFKAILNK
jgi:ABC-type multidrug transport system fused ATPase/permease subunit